MFGKVAKGFFGSDRGTGGDSVSSEVETLLARAADGVLPEDRREALLMLSEVLQGNEQAQRVIGVNGLPVLCSFLRDEKEDTEALRGALECLNNALSPAQGGRQSPGAMNAELFARGEGNIDLLLGLLSAETEFYTCYHSLQLLTTLAAGGASRVAEAVLAFPLGVIKLMDLLSHKHEVVRNEALLLLGGLTHASGEIKRIAAFEGAFEKLLAIIQQEGGTDGGVVVQDCFDMMNSLLRNNAGNQLMLREAGHLQKLPELLKLPDSHFLRSLPRQRAANITALLDTFIVLLLQQPATPETQAPHAVEPQRHHNAAALLKLGLLDKLLMLSLKGDNPSASGVRNQGLLCLAHLISEYRPGQEQLVMSGLGWLKGTPALRQILRLCLHAEEPSQHSAARSVIRAFCRNNLDGQNMLVATLVPAADQNPGNTTFGGEIVRALSQQSLVVSSRAAAVLTCMIDENPAAKQRLLSIPLELQGSQSGPQKLLMPECVSHISDALYNPGGADHRAAAVFLKLLVTWLTSCWPAVKGFLADASNLHFVIDIITERKAASSSIVAGLAALLLGVCLPADQEGESSVILDAITTKVGLAPFFEKLEGLYGDKEFQTAAAGAKAPRPATRATPAAVPQEEEEQPAGSQREPLKHHPENPFEYSFAKWALAFRPQIRQQVLGEAAPQAAAAEAPKSRVLSLQSLPSSQQLQEAESIIQTLERELESLRSRNRALTQQAIDLQRLPRDPGTEAFPVKSAADTAALREAEQRLRQAEATVESIRTERDGLQGALKEAERKREELQGQLREVSREAAEAQGAASKYEADLQALSSAYTSLETHAHDLELQHRKAAGSAPQEEGIREDNGDNDDDEGDAQLNDLLACLGEEEQKVECLKQKLTSMGIDPDILLDELLSSAEATVNDQDLT